MCFKNIMKIENCNMLEEFQQFRARKIANVKHNKVPHLKSFELYSLDNNDVNFTKKMASKINLKKLYPNADSYEYFREWKNIINCASISSAPDNNVVIAVYNKKPCGIMSYIKHKNFIYLSYLAKWRIKPNFDLPDIGKMLMRNLFGVAVKNNINKIYVTPASCKPRGKSCVDFYNQLGFKENIKNVLVFENLNLNKKCAQLENLFEYKTVNNSVNISPNKSFSCNFNEPIMEKFKKLLGKL